METWEWITLASVAGAALVLVLAVLAVASKRRRRSHLQERFGPEYDRAVASSGRRDAEQRLTDVEREHEDLAIRDLPSVTRERLVHVAVDHPDVAERYRHGQAMLETDDGEGESTEDITKAMVDFRSVLDELVGSGEPAAT